MSRHNNKAGCNDCHKDNKPHKPKPSKNCHKDKDCKRDKCKHSGAQLNLTSDIAGLAKVQNASVVGSFGITTVQESILEIGNCQEFEEFLWVANRFSQTLTKHNLKGEVVQTVSTVQGTGATATFHNPLAVIANRNDFVLAGQGVELIVTTYDANNSYIEVFAPSINPTNTIVIYTQGGAYFSGLTMGKKSLFVADFINNTISAFSANLNKQYSFAGQVDEYSTFNVAAYENKLYVVYAQKEDIGNDPVVGDGLGAVDIFCQDGGLFKHLITPGGQLNAPYGIIFDSVNCHIYISNHGSGLIAIFDLKCGDFISYVKTCHCENLTINGIYGLAWVKKGIAFAASPEIVEINGLVGLILLACC